MTYLALGDSYTIGEGIPIYESFPYQTVQLLRAAGLAFHAPEIVAKTGWTTDELQAAIQSTHFLPRYNMVSLCIGVNNQYRGRDAGEYRDQFTALLQQAIKMGEQVFVLSIPDWGITPFANGRDTKAITREIEGFNAINKAVAETCHVTYIENKADARLLAADQLHPSGAEYAKWAKKLAEKAIPFFKQ
jgi:Lysophospholipase L1 and related esterases